MKVQCTLSFNLYVQRQINTRNDASTYKKCTFVKLKNTNIVSTQCCYLAEDTQMNKQPLRAEIINKMKFKFYTRCSISFRKYTF